MIAAGPAGSLRCRAAGVPGTVPEAARAAPARQMPMARTILRPTCIDVLLHRTCRARRPAAPVLADRPCAATIAARRRRRPANPRGWLVEGPGAGITLRLIRHRR